MARQNSPDTVTTVSPQPVFAKPAIAWIFLAIALLALAASWWIFGTRFYDQVLPFYDSVSYQEGYRTIADLSKTQGTGKTVVAVWQEPASNVVLYRFFAAVAGPWLPLPRTGLFVYLFGIHLLAGILLCTTVRSITGRFLPAFAAISVWFLTTPFGLLRDGVGDQRLDLSSGSAFLIVATLGLRWTHFPTHLGAFITGLAAALAALHRPILVPAIAIAGCLFAVTAIVQHRHSFSKWLTNAALALLPIALIAVPWFCRHMEELRVYYLEYGPDVGKSVSLQSAAHFNWIHYQSAFGLPATLALLFGLALTACILRVQLGRALLVLLLWATPLAVLIGSKSMGNTYVQQAALGIPALLFTAWAPRKNESGFSPVFAIYAGLLFLTITVAASPLRLTRALGFEPGRERLEATRMLSQLALKPPTARLAGFHDLPISPIALCMVARDLNLPLQTGTLSYYPSDFGLSNDHLDDISSDQVQRAVVTRLETIKQQDDLLILPTADTAFRLWAGLFSHRLLPIIRTQVQHDPAFQPLQRIGPVKDVYFDVYKIQRN